ncbi:MAG: DUF167 domain-containing protein [Planctomycetota bacterium]
MHQLDQLQIGSEQGAAILPVKAVPGASRDKIAGVLGDALKVTVSAAPEKGKANKALVKFLAKTLDVDRRAITLIAGETSPNKQFRIDGLSVAALRSRLERL